MGFSLWDFFNNDLANTLIHVKGKSILLNEPSVNRLRIGAFVSLVMMKLTLHSLQTSMTDFSKKPASARKSEPVRKIISICQNV